MRLYINVASLVYCFVLVSTVIFVGTAAVLYFMLCTAGIATCVGTAANLYYMLCTVGTAANLYCMLFPVVTATYRMAGKFDGELNLTV